MDMSDEVELQEKATAVCEQLGLKIVVRDTNAVPVLLLMCAALTERVLKLEKNAITLKGNGDGRTIRTVETDGDSS